MPRGTPHNVDKGEFKRVWNAASTPDEVAQYFSMDRAAAMQLARNLRASGMDLKQMDRPAYRKYDIPDELFIQLWQSGTPLAAIAQQFGITERAVLNIVNRLRSQGVDLERRERHFGTMTADQRAEAGRRGGRATASGPHKLTSDRAREIGNLVGLDRHVENLIEREQRGEKHFDINVAMQMIAEDARDPFFDYVKEEFPDVFIVEIGDIYSTCRHEYNRDPSNPGYWGFYLRQGVQRWQQQQGAKALRYKWRTKRLATLSKSLQGLRTLLDTADHATTPPEVLADAAEEAGYPNVQGLRDLIAYYYDLAERGRPAGRGDLVYIWNLLVGNGAIRNLYRFTEEQHG